MMRIYQGTFDLIRALPPFIRLLREANREGMKSQTRRLIALPKWSTGDWQDFELDEYGVPLIISKDTGCQAQIHCPYGEAGNILYMREPLQRGPGDRAYYTDGFTEVKDILTGEPVHWKWRGNSLSQLYMPKIAARLFFQYDFIRVERLQSITNADAILEGIQRINDAPIYAWRDYEGSDQALAPWVSFRSLWESINGSRGYPWSENGWVWVLGYKPFDMKKISVINSNMTEANWRRLHEGEWDMNDDPR